MTHLLGKFKKSLEVIVLGASVLFNSYVKSEEINKGETSSAYSSREERYDNLYNKEVIEELAHLGIIEKEIPPVDKDGKKNINLIRPQNMFDLQIEQRVKDEAKKYIDLYGTGNAGVRTLEKEKPVVEVEEKASNLIDPTKYPLIIQGQLGLEFEFARFSRRYYPYAFYARNGVHGPFQKFLHMFYRKNAIPFDNLNDLEEKISKINPKQKKIVFPSFVNFMGEIISHDEYSGYLRLKEKWDVDLGDLENIHFGAIPDNGLGGIAACGGKMEDLNIAAIAIDKIYGSGGGIILALKDRTREFTFSPSCISARLFQSIPYSQLGAFSKSLEIVHSEEGRKMRQRVSELSQRDKIKLKDMGYELSNSSTPEIYILVGDNKLLIQMDNTLMKGRVFGAPFLDVASYNKKLIGLRIFMPYSISEEDREKVFAAFEEFSPVYNASRNQTSRSMVSISKSLNELVREAKAFDKKSEVEASERDWTAYLINEEDGGNVSISSRDSSMGAIQDRELGGLVNPAARIAEETNLDMMARYLSSRGVQLPNDKEKLTEMATIIAQMSNSERRTLDLQLRKHYTEAKPLSFWKAVEYVFIDAGRAVSK